ncbi:hypothetical protein EGW08_006612 [Elysia chlorotica]|uniref:Uncharacterized protein n=1 Tax=Elysia chlorotica TaxID=188477 RepID=A0A3S1A8U4_ELYCH|nr:hypothetical protein EGW08_006612 [Elysia chlorotica]
MKFGCYKKGKRIPTQQSKPCDCCKFCKVHLQQEQKKQPPPSPPTVSESASVSETPPENLPAFSIFSFPPNQELPEKPSSPFSIYNFPQKQIQTPASAPYSFFQTTPKSKKRPPPSQYSFFPSHVHKTAFNLYQTPNSLQILNIHEKWTFNVLDGTDFERNPCFSNSTDVSSF